MTAVARSQLRSRSADNSEWNTSSSARNCRVQNNVICTMFESLCALEKVLLVKCWLHQSI